MGWVGFAAFQCSKVQAWCIVPHPPVLCKQAVPLGYWLLGIVLYGVAPRSHFVGEPGVALQGAGPSLSQHGACAWNRFWSSVWNALGAFLQCSLESYKCCCSYNIETVRPTWLDP